MRSIPGPSQGIQTFSQKKAKYNEFIRTGRKEKRMSLGLKNKGKKIKIKDKETVSQFGRQELIVFLYSNLYVSNLSFFFS